MERNLGKRDWCQMRDKQGHTCSGAVRLFDVFISPPPYVWAAREWLCEAAFEELNKELEEDGHHLIEVNSTTEFLDNSVPDYFYP